MTAEMPPPLSPPSQGREQCATKRGGNLGSFNRNFSSPQFRARPAPILASLLAVALAGPARGDDSSSPTYERDIKPLFAKRCTVCHRASKRSMLDISAGLALDSLEGTLAGSARDKVIVPGKSRDSELVRRLADQDEDRRMPLQDKPLALPQ